MPNKTPDAGSNEYRPQIDPATGQPLRDAPMVFRKNFLLNKLEPPSDTIRSLLTELEFESAFTPEVAARCELMIQQIEAQLDLMRLAMREAVGGK